VPKMNTGDNLQQTVLGKWIVTCKRMELNSYLHHTQKINLKCIRDLKLRPETPGGNTGWELHAPGLGNDLLDTKKKSQATKAK
jgi:hypothetical protein